MRRNFPWLLFKKPNLGRRSWANTSGFRKQRDDRERDDQNEPERQGRKRYGVGVPPGHGLQDEEVNPIGGETSAISTTSTSTRRMPPSDEAARARRMIEAFDGARAQGRDRAEVDGLMVEVPTYQAAKRLLARAEDLQGA
jgi:hypothetical protein